MVVAEKRMVGGEVMRGATRVIDAGFLTMF